MGERPQLPFFLLISLVIHGICLAVLPAPQYGAASQQELYQVVEMYSGNFSKAHNGDKVLDDTQWLESIDKLDQLTDSVTISQGKNSSAGSPELPLIHSNTDDSLLFKALQEPLISVAQFNSTPSIGLLTDELEVSHTGAFEENSSTQFPNEYKTGEEEISKEQQIDELLKDEFTTDSQIQGPVSARSIIYRPDPPQVHIQSSVTLTFKFWVFPDGTVGKIIPLKKGDAKLEQLAITYLKQWRFNALSGEEPQEEQWGIVPIKFSVI